MTSEPPKDGKPSGQPEPSPRPQKFMVGEKIETPTKEATITDAIKSIKPNDFATVGNNACANRGFQNGVMVGAATGAFRVIVMRARPLSGGNWAVTTGLVVAVITHQVCLYGMRKEKLVMQKTVQAYYDNARTKKAAKAEARAVESRSQALASAGAEVPASKSRPWYRPWW